MGAVRNRPTVHKRPLHLYRHPQGYRASYLPKTDKERKLPTCSNSHLQAALGIKIKQSGVYSLISDSRRAHRAWSTQGRSGPSLCSSHFPG